MLASPLPVTSALQSPLATSDDTISCRPAADIDAFKALLPPAVEFVEASTTFAVAEGTYHPINETPPKAGPSKERSEPLPPSPTPGPRAPKRSLNEPQTLFTHDIDISWIPRFNVASGLYNTGNTCFLNSALQCLLHTPPLLRVLIQNHEPNTCHIKGAFCMACNMRALAMKAHTSKASFSPDLITNKMHLIAKTLKRGRQEDSHEFLRYAIDALQKSCLAGQPPKLDPKLAETTWVHKIFGGKLRSRVSCQSCNHNSDTFDNNLDISLDVTRMPHLRDAFRKFFAPDHLNGRDKYRCEKCKKDVNAEKRFSIHEAPVVLTVHLKRFSPFGNKIGNPVDYDNHLSLKPYMSDGQFGPNYSLYGVICHAGGGPNSGHYFAFVKSREGRWFEMNDECVSPVSSLPVKKTAYVLFYLRNKGDRLASAIAPQPSAARKSIIESMKRKARDDDDTGVPTSKSFIEPILPSSSDSSPDSKKQKLSSGDPQASSLKKKINGMANLALQYGSDDEEEDTGKKMAIDQPARAPSPAQTLARVAIPLTTIPPAHFYGGQKSNFKQRIPPSSDWKHKKFHGKQYRGMRRRAGAV